MCCLLARNPPRDPEYLVVAAVSTVGAFALYAAPLPEAPEISCKLPPKHVGTEDSPPPSPLLADDEAGSAKCGGERPAATGSSGSGGSDNKERGIEKRLLSACSLDQFAYTIELVFSFSVFWLIGGSVSLTSYVKTYVQARGTVEPINEGSEALLMIWVMTTVGRLCGLYDMMRLKHKTIQTVYFHLTLWQLIAVLGMSLALIRPRSDTCFWMSLCLYGLGNGPCIGHSYDLINRLTRNTEEGMSLVMFGLNFGASLVPYTTSLLWEDTMLKQTALFVVAFLSSVLPIGLTALALAFAYAKAAHEAHMAESCRPNRRPHSPAALPTANHR